MSSKICSKCNINKDISNFCKKKGTKDGLQNWCKECIKLSNRCEHGKSKYICKDCGGTQICVHNIRKSRCKECDGKELCEHDRLRNQCKECGGASICEHGRQKSGCKECVGSHICEHGRQKSGCKECGGSQICIHGKLKSRCKEGCGGSSYCEHNKRKEVCKECGGGSICEHNIIRSGCRECGNSYCEHGIHKSRCKEGCGGSAYCEHDKRKDHCIDCNPSLACQECKGFFVDKRTLSYPLCQACFCNKYPDHENSTLYKIKERYLRDELRERFPDKDINMIFDQVVDGGCSKRRPDVMIDILTHTVIVECDENQHKNYECENRRTMELYTDLGNRPLVMIRFNPDKYTDENNKKVKGCFKPIVNIEDIHKKKFYDVNKKEWKRRIDILQEIIKEYIDIIPDKAITEIKLFYKKV